MDVTQKMESRLGAIQLAGSRLGAIMWVQFLIGAIPVWVQFHWVQFLVGAISFGEFPWSAIMCVWLPMVCI